MFGVPVHLVFMHMIIYEQT